MRKLLPLLLGAALLAVSSAPRRAEAGEGAPLFLVLGVAKVPGIAFDIVGAAQLGPRLGDFQDPVLRRVARTSLASNLVTLGLHTLGVGSFIASALIDEDMEPLLFVSCTLNGLADLTTAVLGIVTGVDLLVRLKAAGLQSTDPGIGAMWSAAVNIAMGGFGAIWFLPMTIAVVVSAEDVLGTLEIQTRAYAVRPPVLVPTGTGMALVGVMPHKELRG